MVICNSNTSIELSELPNKKRQNILITQRSCISNKHPVFGEFFDQICCRWLSTLTDYECEFQAIFKLKDELGLQRQSTDLKSVSFKMGPVFSQIKHVESIEGLTDDEQTPQHPNIDRSSTLGFNEREFPKPDVQKDSLCIKWYYGWFVNKTMLPVSHDGSEINIVLQQGFFDDMQKVSFFFQRLGWNIQFSRRS